MASKFGARPVGTDGSDFRHRQRVALHYKESVANKFRLKCALALHGSLAFLLLLKLVEDILDRFQIDWAPLERLKVPEPHFWEYWWLTSALPCVASLTTLARNNERRLRLCYYGFFLLGLIPVAIGAGKKLPELLDYLEFGASADESERPPIEVFLGVPMVVVWFMFFAIAFQVHVFSMYFASHLIKAWQPASRPAAVSTSISGGSSTEKSSSNNDRASWQNDKKIK